MADNKITIIQGSDTIQVVQPNNEIVVSVNQESNVVTIVEKGPKGDKGESGNASDITAINNFTGSIQTQVNNINLRTGSFATTGSNNFIGNQRVTGSLSAMAFTGSLFGTSSWAEKAITASYSVSASQSQNTISSSFASTASYAVNAVSSSYAISASNYNETDPIFTAVSGTFATTGSNNFKGNQTISGSIYLNSGSVINSTGADIIIKAGVGTNAGVVLYNNSFTHYLAVDDTGSYANKFTAAVSINAPSITGSLFGTASNAVSSSYATTASFAPNYVLNSATSSFATTGSNTFIGNQIITGSVAISGTASLNGNNIVSSTTVQKIETITTASYAGITPVSGTLYIIIG
jgi:hypothetical protein